MAEPQCNGPHGSAFDCPVHDPRKRPDFVSDYQRGRQEILARVRMLPTPVKALDLHDGNGFSTYECYWCRARWIWKGAGDRDKHAPDCLWEEAKLRAEVTR